MIRGYISITQRKDFKCWAGDQMDRYYHFTIACEETDYKVVVDHFNYIALKDRISDNWLLNEIQTKYRANHLYDAFISLLNYFKVHFPEITIQIYDWNSKDYLKETI